MRIVLNCLPLKTGGGVQVAHDLLREINRSKHAKKWSLVAREGMPFLSDRFCSNLAATRAVKDTLRSRLSFEVAGARRFVESQRGDAVFTLFGPHWYRIRVPQVVGCAYSNLLYPEMEFWGRLDAPRRFVKKIIDEYRRRRLLSADGAIFETDNLAARAVSTLGMRPDRVACIRPSVSALVNPAARDEETAKLAQNLPGNYRVLALSGYHSNKYLDLIPRALHILKEDSNGDDVVFVMTLPDCQGTTDIFRLADSLGVGNRMVNLGPVPQQGCVELYRQTHAVYLGSQLESFSNTIAESWRMSKPLLISDLEWARGICQNAAVFFEFANHESLAQRIISLRTNPELSNDAVSAGKAMLAEYPASGQRLEQIFTFIESTVRRSKNPQR